MQQGISVLIPAYNEAESIEETILEILKVLDVRRAPFELIIVNDGSTDDTPKRIPSHPNIRVIAHPGRMGYGRSLKDAISEARYNNIVITDADATYPAEAIPRLVRCLGRTVMAVGQRKSIYYPRMQSLKIFSRRLINLLAWVLIFKKIPDLNSGLRAFRKDWITPHLQTLCNGFSFSSSLTLLACLQSKAIHWEPIDYRTRKGQSKVRFLKDGIRLVCIFLSTVWRFAPQRLILPAVVLAGLFLRLLGITWGFPYIFNGDEPHFINLAVSFGTGDLNPHIFKYPTLWMYVLFIAYGIYYVLWSFFGILRSVEEFGCHFVTNPASFYLIGRLLSTAFSCLGLIVFFKLEDRFNRPKAATRREGEAGATSFHFPWGIFLLVVSPVLVLSAHEAKADSLMFFLSALSWFYALKIYSEGRGVNYFLAGLFSGLAFSTQYTAVPTLLLVPLAYFLARRKNSNSGSSIFWLGIGLLASGAGFVLGSPYAVLDFPAFINGLRDMQAYIAMVSQSLSYNPWDTVLGVGLNQFKFAGPWSLAWMGLLFGIWQVWKRDIRLLMLLVLPIVFYGAFMCTKPDSIILRYYSACFIPLALIASQGLKTLGHFPCEAGLHQKWQQRWVLAIALLAYMPGVWVSLKSDLTFLRPDTRESAARWIELNIPVGSGILMDQLDASPQVLLARERVQELYRKTLAMGSRRARYYELLLKSHPGGGYRIYRIKRPHISMPKHVEKSQKEGPYIDVSGGLRVINERGIRYVVTTSYGATLFTDPELKNFFHELFSQARVLAKFRPDRKTVAGPTISIYDIAATRPGERYP